MVGYGFVHPVSPLFEIPWGCHSWGISKGLGVDTFSIPPGPKPLAPRSILRDFRQQVLTLLFT